MTVRDTDPAAEVCEFCGHVPLNGECCRAGVLARASRLTAEDAENLWEQGLVPNGPVASHRTSVLDLTHPQDPLGLFGAQCSCGWTSESLWSDPETAEEDAARHESEAYRA